MESGKKAYLYVIPSILIWASSPVVAKMLIAEMDSLQIVLFASMFASVFLFATTVIRNRSVTPLKYGTSDYAIMFFLGALLFLQYVFLYLSIYFLSAHEAFIITYLWPICLVIFAVPVLKEKLTFKKVAGLLLGFAGVYTIATRGDLLNFSFAHPLGNALAVAVAIVVGFFFILTKKYRYDKFSSLFFFYVFTFILALVSTLLFSTVPHLSVFQLLGVMWIGIAIYSVAYISWFSALHRGDTAKVSNLGYLVPPVSLVYVHFMLDEPILVSSLIGLVLIMAGIFIQYRRRS